jgi:hypothetical protein
MFPEKPWQYEMVVGLVILVFIVSLAAVRRFQRIGLPLIDFTRVRPGRPWRKNWPKLPESSEVLVAFLSTSCPKCGAWPKVLNAVHGLSDMPAPLAVIADNSGDTQRWVDENQVRFPVVRIGLSAFNQLVCLVPAAAWIENGVIRQVWLGGLPDEFLNRLRVKLAAKPATNVSTT